MLSDLVAHTRVLDIVGDVCRVRTTDVESGDLAVVENVDGESSVAKVIALQDDVVSLLPAPPSG